MEDNKEAEQKDGSPISPRMRTIRFVVGCILFIALVAIHVLYKDLPVWIIGLPSILWGVDAASIINRR